MGSPFFGNRRYLDTDKARELYDIGYCDPQIAAICDVTTDTVRAWRRKNGLVGYNKPYREEEKKRTTPTLTELAAEAKAHKMSYGQYMVAKKEGWL